MFKKILIANRGEIAARICRSAKELGVQTVAVYSDADAGAKHVVAADEAVRIGAAPVGESYLRGDVIIEAALRTGAQAIHPGYGFLSENPDFVDAVEAAGLVFIGPSAKAIRAMGLKDAAKALMIKAGVPVAPGYHGADQDDQLLADEAAKIGYPVMIKAVAGGGGKGMRLVQSETDFSALLQSARSEARSSFGNDAVLVEKFITNPRHIEIQVFGDGFGNVVHLFERDCSLQRRHQKVIEEAPAPGMTQEMRDAMGQAAVAAAQAIGYEGAGTVEFIVDGSGVLDPTRFWFMEMNARLQVEHPVTEAITGQDLVAWQLGVASGEALPCTQSDLSITGHSFEARIYAEDVPAGFLPATGTIAHLAFPGGARADSAVRSGDTISPFYDPMIAKLIVHGADRSQALAKLSAALADTQIAGTTTNLAFLHKLSEHSDFAAGKVDTRLIDRDIDALSAAPEVPLYIKALAAIGALGLHEINDDLAGFSQWTALSQSVELTLDADFTAQVATHSATQFNVSIGDTTLVVEQEGWTVDGHRTDATIIVSGRDVTIFDRHGFRFQQADPLAIDAAASSSADTVEAPMPGLVKSVSVSVGDSVKSGQSLCVLEAMKMEHSLTAPRDGVVETVGCQTGDQVQSGSTLLMLEPIE